MQYLFTRKIIYIGMNDNGVIKKEQQALIKDNNYI